MQGGDPGGHLLQAVVQHGLHAVRGGGVPRTPGTRQALPEGWRSPRTPVASGSPGHGQEGLLQHLLGPVVLPEGVSGEPEHGPPLPIEDGRRRWTKPPSPRIGFTASQPG